MNLKFLEFVRTGLKVKKASFNKSCFTNGPMNYYLWNFERVLDEAPDEIPAFEGSLTKLRLTKAMNDTEIREEIGNGALSVCGALAIIAAITESQSNGKDRNFATTRYGRDGPHNILYVKLRNGEVIAIGISWEPRRWGLYSYNLDDGRWSSGGCVFVF